METDRQLYGCGGRRCSARTSETGHGVMTTLGRNCCCGSGAGVCAAPRRHLRSAMVAELPVSGAGLEGQEVINRGPSRDFGAFCRSAVFLPRTSIPGLPAVPELSRRSPPRGRHSSSCVAIRARRSSAPARVGAGSEAFWPDRAVADARGRFWYPRNTDATIRDGPDWSRGRAEPRTMRPVVPTGRAPDRHYEASSRVSRSRCPSMSIRAWKISTTSSVSGFSRRIR